MVRYLFVNFSSGAPLCYLLITSFLSFPFALSYVGWSFGVVKCKVEKSMVGCC
jgi:hypothetical protein